MITQMSSVGVLNYLKSSTIIYFGTKFKIKINKNDFAKEIKRAHFATEVPQLARSYYLVRKLRMVIKLFALINEIVFKVTIISPQPFFEIFWLPWMTS